MCSFTRAQLARHADAAVAGVDVEIALGVIERHRAVAGRERELARPRRVARMLPSPVRSSSMPRTSLDSNRAVAALAVMLPSRGIVTISLRGRRAVADAERARRPARAASDLDLDAVAVLLRLDLQLVDRFLRRSALLDFHDDRFASPERISIEPSKVVSFSSGAPDTVNRFSSRAMCPCESTTTQPAERQRGGEKSCTAGSTDFIQLSWTGLRRPEFPQPRSGRPAGPGRGRPGRRPRPGAITPKPCSPSARAGVVEQTVAASDRLRPTSDVKLRETRDPSSACCPASVPSSRYAASLTVIGRPPRRGRGPGRTGRSRRCRR